jgi:uncharacterized membrane protein YeaQ/YmgE (transglycosylase-associated protein family)
MTIFGISLANIVLWIVFGVMIALIVHLFDPHKIKGGLFSTLKPAITGSLLGGIMASILHIKPLITINFEGIILAIAISLILVLIVRTKLRHRIKTKTHWLR